MSVWQYYFGVLSWLQNTDRKARRDIEALTEGLEGVERKLRSLELAWNDTLDRVNRIMGRIVKRAEIDDKRAAQGEGDGPRRALTPARGEVPSPDPRSILTRRYNAVLR